MTTTIIGTGLIGGSFALALREYGISDNIIGVESNTDNAQTALRLGIVESVSPLEEACAAADLIIIASPVDTIPSLAVRILKRIGAGQTVMDVGSTKAELREMIRLHPNRGRLVATHPMWGTEYSGPEAAEKGAFAGRTAVICDSDESDPDALRTVERIYRKFGMPLSYMDSEEHDTHAAYISHISHITSFALALTVLEKELEDDRIFELAGGGFESTVRLAKSSPRTWVPIIMQNKYNVLDVLREHIHQLQILRRMIERDDCEGLTESFARANTIRRILHPEK